MINVALSTSWTKLTVVIFYFSYLLSECLVSVGDMLNSNTVLSSACELADTRYYRPNLFN